MTLQMFTLDILKANNKNYLRRVDIKRTLVFKY